MNWIENISFICPECRIGKLKYAKDRFNCEECQTIFTIEENVPVLISSADLAYFEFLNRSATLFDDSEIDKHFTMVEWRYKRTLDLLRRVNNLNTVLDIGAGYGGLCRILKERGYTVIATDINIGRAKAISLRGIPYFVSLASNIPLADESVDGVCLIATLPHFPYPEIILKEIGRVLKQGGVCVVDFFNIANLYWRLKFLIGDWQSISSRLGWHYFQSTLTKNQFLKIAQKYGLRLNVDGSYTPIPKTKKTIHLPITSLSCVRYSFLLSKV